MTESVGRGVDQAFDRLRAAILEGRYSVGKFLPPVRTLSGEAQLSAETIRRGLKLLEKEGLVQAQSRKGFRVVAQTLPGGDSRPVAYVTSNRNRPTIEDPTSRALAEAFRGSVADRGWTLLGVHVGEAAPETTLDQLRAGNAWGLIVDTTDRKLFDVATHAGVPIVMVNSWFENTSLDVVLQDNYRGGFLAGSHLVQSGSRRIGWLGNHTGNCHSRERYGGVVAAVESAGLHLDPVVDVRSADDFDDVTATVRRCLSAPNRPDGLAVFYPRIMRSVLAVCAERGLIVGRDIHLMGWVVDELYDQLHRPLFGNGPVAPAIVWTAASMANQALKLLETRRHSPGSESVRLCVPTRLRME